METLIPPGDRGPPPHKSLEPLITRYNPLYPVKNRSKWREPNRSRDSPRRTRSTGVKPDRNAVGSRVRDPSCTTQVQLKSRRFNYTRAARTSFNFVLYCTRRQTLRCSNIPACESSDRFFFSSPSLVLSLPDPWQAYNQVIPPNVSPSRRI